MKPNVIPLTVAAGWLLAATSDLWALPPRQHSVHGVIATIECARRTLTLQAKDGAAPQTFLWNDSTRFSHHGGCARCGLNSGQTVRGWYRREVGQNVLREISTEDVGAGCDAVCKQAGR